MISVVITQPHTRMVSLFMWREKFSKIMTTKILTFFTMISPTAAQQIDTNLFCHIGNSPIYSGLIRPSSVRYSAKA